MRYLNDLRSMFQKVQLKKHQHHGYRYHSRYIKTYSSVAKGFTLIELMIALVIASLLALSTWISFNSTNQSNNNQTAVSDIRDNAFYILDRFEYMIRHAGFNHYISNTNQLFSRRPAANSWVAFPAQYNTTNFNQTNDQVSVDLQIPDFNNQEMSSCTGSAIPPSTNINDTYNIRLYTQGNAAQTQLLCEVRRNGTIIQGPAIVAQNIGRFKVFYRQMVQNGTQEFCGDAWQSAQSVGINFNRVCSVHLALVALSQQQTLQSVAQTIQIAPDATSQNADTLVTVGANQGVARLARFMPKTIQTRNQ
jgi:prepilin-type N-terminal cleavage/methylation domain-containing protein